MNNRLSTCGQITIKEQEGQFSDAGHDNTSQNVAFYILKKQHSLCKHKEKLLTDSCSCSNQRYRNQDVM